ncbi:MAG: rhodanese-like domain-containing protein [Deltaproteobacteria bacterium]|nr:rhodanese-like domain-containing protein [Deltaproteobacteria bacterium]
MTLRAVLALPLALGLALALASCSRTGGDAPAQGSSAPAKKDPAAAKALIGDGAVVLDVRSPDEYAGGHLSQAANIPVQDLSARLAEVEKLVGGAKERPIVVYCAAGGRAGKAKQQLEAAGFTNVVNGGGYDDLR